MRGEAVLTVPELARVLGTRAALGIGLGLVLADRFATAESRRAVGWTLLAVGAFAGATLAAEIFGRPRAFSLAFGPAKDEHEIRPEARERLGDRGAFSPT
jgi:hypothetical protein